MLADFLDIEPIAKLFSPSKELVVRGLVQENVSLPVQSKFHALYPYLSELKKGLRIR